MKYLLPFTLIFILSSICPLSVFSQRSHKKKYRDLLEPESKLLRSGYNFTLEQLKADKVIYKQYFPDTRVLTHRYQFASKKMKNFHGLSEEYYDDGELIYRGNYVNNIKQGLWIEESTDQGVYKNGLKEGIWSIKDDKGRIIRTGTYVQGKKEGAFVRIDTLNHAVLKEIYHSDILVSIQSDSSYIDYADSTIIETMPRFNPCEEMKFDEDKRKKCADKAMLFHVYNNIKYPRKAREEGIQGSVTTSFVIDKDGTIDQINIRRGLCKEIKEECYNIITSMPKWIPGTRAGKAVRVQFNLPINFRLE